MLASSMLSREMKPLSPVLQSYWLGIHAVFAFLGNAAFALAFGIGLMYLVQEHYVKSKHPGGLFGRLPSLQTLDEINYRLITIGFPLLTLAIITGHVMGRERLGKLLELGSEGNVVADYVVYLCDRAACPSHRRLERQAGGPAFHNRIFHHHHRLFRH